MSKIEFTPMDVAEAGRISSVRLIEMAGRPLFLTATTTRGGRGVGGHRTAITSLDPAKAEAAGTPLFTVDQLLPGRPGWDVFAGPDGTCLLAVEFAAGATTEVFVRDRSGRGHAVARRQGIRGLAGPRFIRRAAGTRARSLSVVSGFERLAVSDAGASPPYSATVEVCEAVGAVLVEAQGRLNSFYKTDTPSAEKHAVQPGVLHWVALGDGYRLKGDPVGLLSGEAVYDLDADAACEGLAAVAATADALHLLWRPARGESFESFALEGDFDAAKLSQLCVLGSPEDLTIAALEAPGSDEARLLLGRVSPDKLG